MSKKYRKSLKNITTNTNKLPLNMVVSDTVYRKKTECDNSSDDEFFTPDLTKTRYNIIADLKHTFRRIHRSKKMSHNLLSQTDIIKKTPVFSHKSRDTCYDNISTIERNIYSNSCDVTPVNNFNFTKIFDTLQSSTSYLHNFKQCEETSINNWQERNNFNKFEFFPINVIMNDANHFKQPLETNAWNLITLQVCKETVEIETPGIQRKCTNFMSCLRKSTYIKY